MVEMLRTVAQLAALTAEIERYFSARIYGSRHGGPPERFD